MCRVGEAHLGMICLKVVVKFIAAKGRLWLEKVGDRGQHQQPGEQAGGGHGGVAQPRAARARARQEEN